LLGLAISFFAKVVVSLKGAKKPSPFLRFFIYSQLFYGCKSHKKVTQAPKKGRGKNCPFLVLPCSSVRKK
jgi:hypothetical protein